MKLRFTLLGQPVSKANRRQIVPTKTGGYRSIKSPEALAFEAAALAQVPPKLRLALEGPMAIRLKCFYASQRSDLDESLVLDCLQNRYQRLQRGSVRTTVLTQKGVVKNDRQFRVKHVYHGIDKRNPRVEVTIWPITTQRDFFGFDDLMAELMAEPREEQVEELELA